MHCKLILKIYSIPSSLVSVGIVSLPWTSLLQGRALQILASETESLCPHDILVTDSIHTSSNSIHQKFPRHVLFAAVWSSSAVWPAGTWGSIFPSLASMRNKVDLSSVIIFCSSEDRNAWALWLDKTPPTLLINNITTERNSRWCC